MKPKETQGRSRKQRFVSSMINKNQNQNFIHYITMLALDILMGKLRSFGREAFWRSLALL
jgi:hypothetical protein